MRIEPSTARSRLKSNATDCAMIYFVKFVCPELGQGMTRCSGEYCFRVMYCEWYGICGFVVLSVVEVCADYGGVNVFHVCLS